MRPKGPIVPRCREAGRWRCAAALLLVAAAALGATAATATGNVEAPSQTIEIVYISREYEEAVPLSLVDKIATDQGLQGARIAIDENNRTGRLIGHEYVIKEVVAKRTQEYASLAREAINGRTALVVADLEADDLIALADMPEAKQAVILDIRTSEDRLRHEGCRGNVLHIRASHAMKADALAQYLVWKKWRRWAMIVGKRPKDVLFAAAVRRAASRFGARIVEERSYTFEPGARRTDTGHQQIQTQMPQLTQGLPEHDVVMVADEEETFGEYLLFRTYEPRPIAGTHGLIATQWHRSFEEYAATQMQNRFERRTNRAMTERDYAGWLAVRIFGEAVTRTGKWDGSTVKNYLLSDQFEVAGFKGQGLNFRRWDQQLRQPMLIAGPRALVSISPQEGFLHPHHLTDTLGFDEPESKCRLNR